MARISLLAALLVALLAAALAALMFQGAASTPAARFALPAADGHHQEPAEWWYWSGHLATDDGHRFGFQVTFFLVEGRLLVDHAALTDITGGAFHRLQGVHPTNAKVPQIDLVRGNTRARRDGDRWELAATFGDRAFALSTGPGAAVLHHGDGYRTFPAGGYTYYYSRPRLQISGTVTTGESKLAVTGEGWFDHQWGDLGPISDAGWDWFGIQLEDGRSLMLLRVRSSREVIDGTLIDPRGATPIDPAEVVLSATGSWTSPESGCSYPSGWRLRAAGLELVVTPALEAQEQVLADPAASYWEGAATVSGGAKGRAYVELTGYCER